MNKIVIFRHSLSNFVDRFFDNWKIICLILSLLGIVFVYGLLIPPPPLISLPKTPASWSWSIPSRNYTEYKITEWTPKYRNLITHTGDLFLKENESLLIENCTYILKGALLVKDNAGLFLRNAELWIDQKSGWSSNDLIPYSANLIFTNSSRLEVINSSIISSDSFEISMLGSSNTLIDSSNLSQAFIYGDYFAKMVIKKSQTRGIGLIRNSTCSIIDSHLLFIGPETNQMIKFNEPIWKDVSVEVYNCSIDRLRLSVIGSEVTLKGSLKGEYPLWSPSSTICDGGKSFSITLHDSEIDATELYVLDSEVTISNERNLSSLWVDGCVLKITNSSIIELGMADTIADIEDSVLNLYTPHENTAVTLSRCLLNTLLFHNFSGVLNFDQVKVLRMTGLKINGFIKGDLIIENKSVDFWDRNKFTRNYVVIVETGGRAVSNVVLRLQNNQNKTVLIGKTDSSGKASFNVTFCKNWKVGEYEYANNFTSSMMLFAVDDDSISAPVQVMSNTPIIFTLTMKPEQPMWSQGWFFSSSSALIIVIVLIAFYLNRMRERNKPRLECTKEISG